MKTKLLTFGMLLTCFVNGLGQAVPTVNWLKAGDVDCFFVCGGLAGAGGSYPFVYSVALQPDGKVLIGGYFTTVNGVPAPGIARLWGSEVATPAQAVEALIGSRMPGPHDRDPFVRH